MPVPEDMRHTRKVQLRLAPEVVRALDELRGEQGRSSWVAELIVKAARRLGLRAKGKP